MSIETFQPAAGVSAVLQPAALPEGIATLRAWASVATEAAQLVSPLIETAFVPEVFRPKIDPRATIEERQAARQVAIATATAAVLYGAGLGLDPLQSLSSIHVVKGKPGLYAETMVALLKGAGHEVGVEDESDTRVRVWGRRKGSQDIERAEFTIDRAKKAGYVAQNAKYTSDPRSMLYARAVSILCRRLAPEVLKGIASVEETTDEPDGTARPATRTVQRAPQRPELGAAPVGATAAPQVAHVPSGPPLPGEEEGAIDAGEVGIDEAVWRAINNEFVKLGVTGPGQTDKRLRVIGTLIQRGISKGSELTAAEGTAVLNTLQANGRAVVHEILAPRPVEQQETAPSGPPLPGEGFDEDDYAAAVQEHEDEAARAEAAAEA